MGFLQSLNRYTADRRIRSDDAYTCDGAANKRPDRAVIVYAQRCREAYPDTPIVLGGIEASLRRIAHYDYWSDKIRRSILLDAKADILLYGNAERAIIELAHRLGNKQNIATINDIRGSVVINKVNETKDAVPLPSYDQVKADPIQYNLACRQIYLESNPDNARALTQQYGDRELLINPPPQPLTTNELDHIYELPYTRLPHPSYGDAVIPAYEMIRFSVTIMRGCFGGCSFCSITAHEGRKIQNRSEASILREIQEIRDKTPGFTGIISDLGGPTANMYQLRCKNPQVAAKCRRFSCIYPRVCKNLITNHNPLIKLYRQARQLPGIKKILIASGVRYDLALESPQYVKELAQHHVGGYLKIAPEHICKAPLKLMMKPGIESYEEFKKLFIKFSLEVKKEQYLIPYFISAHPGTTDSDMLELAIWLKTNNFRLNKVQNFIPTPMTLSSAMYYSQINILNLTGKNNNIETIFVAKNIKQRRLHKAFLRYHDPDNWPLLRAALKRMGRSELIGNSKKHLIPLWQPKHNDNKGKNF